MRSRLNLSIAQQNAGILGEIAANSDNCHIYYFGHFYFKRKYFKKYFKILHFLSNGFLAMIGRKLIKIITQPQILIALCAEIAIGKVAKTRHDLESLVQARVHFRRDNLDVFKSVGNCVDPVDGHQQRD